jgi:hypothetical protein
MSNIHEYLSSTMEHAIKKRGVGRDRQLITCLQINMFYNRTQITSIFFFLHLNILCNDVLRKDSKLREERISSSPHWPPSTFLCPSQAILVQAFATSSWLLSNKSLLTLRCTQARNTYFKLMKNVSTFGSSAPAMAKFVLPVSTRTLNWKHKHFNAITQQ